MLSTIKSALLGFYTGLTGANIDAIVKRLGVWGVSMLFVIGGDGGELLIFLQISQVNPMPSSTVL